LHLAGILFPDINANLLGFQLSNKPNEKSVGPEGKQSRVRKIFCRQRDLVTIMACTNANDNFIQPVATFKGKECNSELADDFPNIVFFAMTDCEWLREKCFHDQAALFSGKQNCRTLSLDVRWSCLQLKICRF